MSTPSVLVRSATAAATPALRRGTRERLVPIGNDLFRVLDATGRITGHLRVVVIDGGERYSAQRFNARRAAFVEVGEFWSADDAVRALHC